MIASHNFNDNVTGVDDAYGHGTAVAGIMAGNGTAGAGQYIGIAPEANLINLRVNDGSGAAPTSAIMNAILWAVQNKTTYNIRVMNLSLQSSVQESYQTSPIDAAVEYAWLKGIVVVVAAGNQGAQAGHLMDPAADPYVLAVGADDSKGTPSVGDDVTSQIVSAGDFTVPSATTAFMYTLGAGVEIPVTRQWAVDAGYRFSRVSADTPVNAQGVTFGIGYRF